MASHRRSLSTGRTARGAVLTAAAAAALAAVPAAAPAEAAPHPDRQEVRAGLDQLYTQAERATEAYNRSEERADKLRVTVRRATDAVARAQERVNTMRGAVGSLAAAQYRSGGIDPALALLLTSDPDRYLSHAALLDQVGAQRAAELGRLLGAQRALVQDRTEAREALRRLERTRKEVARHKRTVEAKLAAARRLLNALPAGERAELRDAAGGMGDFAGAAHARAARGAGFDVPPGTAAVSGRAAAAVAAARSALGRPYVWGASGPGAFDCSGLMQWAWGRAGVGLPRTSQAQAGAGQRVPLSQARPGDLVTYRSDASHVGMYVGGGQVIHAPHPGAAVRYESVHMLPINSVTRP
ncbi:NlpC/P60 family protein [Streptomyces sp. NRRL F-5630]|uniref:C40 family peptidase n=1 Tax=Streptomyces sp. NRRL F-5630 TaxID=1463864 RepID=UPI003D757EE5